VIGVSEKFTGKLISIGNSKAFTVPAFLIREGRIVEGKEYEIIVSEKNTSVCEEKGEGGDTS